MKKIICFFLITCFTVPNSYASFDKTIVCNENDSTIQRMQEYLAKKDITKYIIDKFSELEIEILEDSLEFDFIKRSTYYDRNERHIYVTLLTSLGSEIKIRGPEREFDPEGNEFFPGLRPSFKVREYITRDNEGRPVSRSCIIKTGYSNGYFSFINKSHDDYIIHTGNSYDVFKSGYTYSLLL